MAGTSNGRGYSIIRFDGRVYPSHRVAWFLSTGSWPLGVIDHINGDGLDNRLINLRDVTQQQNLFNTKLYVNNNTGFRGVHYHIRDKVFTACISINGKQKHLGTFDSAEEASIRYELEKECYHII